MHKVSDAVLCRDLRFQIETSNISNYPRITKILFPIRPCGIIFDFDCMDSLFAAHDV